MRHLRERHNWLFAFGLWLAVATSALAPFLHVMLAFDTPWRSADLAKYDLRPGPAALLLYDLGHGSTIVAGLLGALLVLIAASAMRWYEGVPLALLALALGWWNATAAFGMHLW